MESLDYFVVLWILKWVMTLMWHCVTRIFAFYLAVYLYFGKRKENREERKTYNHGEEDEEEGDDFSLIAFSMESFL